MENFKSNVEDQSFECIKCGLKKKTTAFYFATKEELLEELKHTCERNS